MEHTDRQLAPLGPPPRKARLRRGVYSLRRSYRTALVLIIVIFGGWAILDAVHLYESAAPLAIGGLDFTAPANRFFMMLGNGLTALIALAVFLWSERSLRRELRLARHGASAMGTVLAAGKARRKRARAWIAYSFCTAAGATVQGRSIIPRATPAALRAPGAAIEVLYDPLRPEVNKARLGLDFIEFG